MCEAWEEILMQMDSRLTKFVQVMFVRFPLEGVEVGTLSSLTFRAT